MGRTGCANGRHIIEQYSSNRATVVDLMSNSQTLSCMIIIQYQRGVLVSGAYFFPMSLIGGS